MKAIVFVLLSIWSLSSFAQNDNKHSIGVDANYLSAIKKEASYNFNYGFSFLMSEKVFHRIKLSIGVNYTSIGMYNLAPPSQMVFFNQYNKEYQYDAEYLNFPFILSFIPKSEKKFTLDPYIGVIARKMIRYDYINYSKDPSYHLNKSKVPDRLGWYYRTGIDVSKSIHRHFVLKVSPYLDLLLVQYAKFEASSPHPPMDDFTFGYQVGLDYQW